ncbi:MAG: TIGR04282 family arsenosugar biosynthesis glycosyltransferase [Sandaracinaceae bacterium]
MERDGSSQVEWPASVALGVFAKAPLAGRAKTRLAPALGEGGAAVLYEAFLADTLERFRMARVFVASPDDVGFFRERFRDRPPRVQADGDLGVRMERALADLLDGADAAVLIGSDAPTLPFAYVAGAARRLSRGADVVLGPSADGGYVLIGCRARPPSLSGAIRFSTAHALDDTIAALVSRRIERLAPWYDVDTPADLRLLRAHLALDPAAAPRTATALRRLASAADPTRRSAF